VCWARLGTGPYQNQNRNQNSDQNQGQNREKNQNQSQDNTKNENQSNNPKGMLELTEGDRSDWDDRQGNY
jgi:hypothetical protein